MIERIMKIGGNFWIGASGIASVVHAQPRSPRTDAICKQPGEQKRPLAVKNDSDGIYCLAVLYAHRYADKRYPKTERQVYRANAVGYTSRAESLGYRVHDLRAHIAGGDNISQTGSFTGRPRSDPKVRESRCEARARVACAAQCGGAGGACFYQSVGSSTAKC